MIFSDRMNNLTSAIFSQLEEKKRHLLNNNIEVIDLSIGTPDVPPSERIRKIIAEEALKSENYVYAINDLTETKDAVINWYNNRFDVDLEYDEITSLLGSQEGLGHVSLTLTNPGDVALVPDPGYPIFKIGPLIANAKIKGMDLVEENNYIIDFNSIEKSIAQKAKMMIVSYPNNPVTAVAPPHFYEELIWFAKKYDIKVIHDNAYSELAFDGLKCGSFLNFKGAKDIGIEFNSLSKTYSVPGARIAFAVGNSKMIKQLTVIKSHMDYGMFLPLQKAATAILNGPQDSVIKTRRIYEKRRNIFIDGLKKYGWEIRKPEGTMFVWAKIPKDNNMNSMEFTIDLLEKTGVIVVPGSSFGKNGEGYVRVALVQDEEAIQRAVDKIGKYLENN